MRAYPFETPDFFLISGDEGQNQRDAIYKLKKNLFTPGAKLPEEDENSGTG